jgi:hypothetical protein
MLLSLGNIIEKLLSEVGERMSDYIYTVDGEIVNVDSLAHYGVPGMKWGQRRARKADKAIRRFENRRAHDKLDRDYIVNETKIKYADKPKKAKKVDRIIKRTDKIYDNKDAINNYAIAKQKIKKDKTYKKTSEYKKIRLEGRKAIGKRYVNSVILKMIES